MINRKQTFKSLQHAFTQAIRDPEHATLPKGFDPERMEIYQQLFLNNFGSILKSAFPVLVSVLDKALWDDLVKYFLRDYRAKTQLFFKIPQEFLNFLEIQTALTLPPYAYELAHYEWMELALELDPATLPVVDYTDLDHVLKGIPVLSPCAKTFQYQYPVHTIDREHVPDHTPDMPTFLVIVRRRDDTVKFMQINQVTAHMIALMAGNDTLTGETILQHLVEAMQHPDPNVVIEGGRTALQALLDQDIVLGSLQPRSGRT